MANKPRAGIDFFSRYVRLPDYEKLIRSDCGVERMYAFVRLIDRIGDTGGYYTSWNDDICELFAIDEHYTKEDIDIVVSSAIKRNFFDRDMYEKYSILTSSHLQELYIMATESRRYVLFNKNYILFNLSSLSKGRLSRVKIQTDPDNIIDSEEFISQNIYNEEHLLAANNDFCAENSNLMDTNDEKTPTIPQRKGKESKVKESKVKESKGKDVYITADAEKSAPPSPPDRETGAVRHKYGEYKNVLLSDEELDKLKGEFPTDWEQRIERLSEYIASTGKSYKSYLATIRAWSKKEARDPPVIMQRPKPKSDYDRFMEQLAAFSKGE